MATISCSSLGLFTGLPMGEKPSLISLQIQLMGEKIGEVQKKLESLGALYEGEGEKIVSDAIDLLAHYEYAVLELMKPFALRDSSLRYFNEYSCRILMEENPSPLEITMCEDLLSQIKSCGLDLSQAQDLISYRGAAFEIEEVGGKISQIVNRCFPFILKLFHTAGEGTIIPRENWEEWNSAVSELDELIKIIYQMVRDHRLGIINSFTVEAQSKFLEVALASNQKVAQITPALSSLSRRKTLCIKKGSGTEIIRKHIIDIIEDIHIYIKASTSMIAYNGVTKIRKSQVF